MADNLHAGHRERLKKRFLNYGLSGFEEHNILELLLFFGIPYKDTNETAHELLQKFGSIENITCRSVEELTSIKNMTENAAILLKLIPDISRIYSLKTQHDKTETYSLDTIKDRILIDFIGCESETVFIYFFDGEMKLVSLKKIERESDLGTAISSRTVVETALECKATSIVMAHSHPSGKNAISMDDIAYTSRLDYLLSELGIDLLEHFVVCDKELLGINNYAENSF